MVRCFLILNSLWSVETTYPSCMAKKLSGLECHPLHNCLPGLQQNQLIRLEWPKWCMANKTVYNTGNVTSIWQTGSVGRFVPRAKGVEVIHFPLHSLLHLPFWHGVVLDFAFGGIIVEFEIRPLFLKSRKVAVLGIASTMSWDIASVI